MIDLQSDTARWVWPEDPAFRTLARAVADGVTIALNGGLRITRARRSDLCCCPLGAVLISRGRQHSTHPGASAFLSVLSRSVALFDTETVLPDERMVWAFIGGFEEGRESPSPNFAVQASAELGIVYRKRFEGQGPARWTEQTRRQRKKAAPP